MRYILPENVRDTRLTEISNPYKMIKCHRELSTYLKNRMLKVIGLESCPF